MKHILITGGSGLVGRKLTKILLKKGIKVSWLSRSGKSIAGVRGLQWNLEGMTIDADVFDTVDAIIHLAGEGVANRRWTSSQKKKILNSRITSSKLLYQELNQSNHKVQSFVSASATGYYGDENGDRLLKEGDQHGDDFLALVTKQWEKEVDLMKSLSLQVTKLRFGVVLSKYGGALEKMALPIRWRLGASFGKGDQYMSWVHIDDLCQMIIHSLDNKLEGIYNAVAPNPVTNNEMTKAIGKQLNRAVLLPNVPSFVLKILLGEMSGMLLGSSKVSSEKIEKEGFQF